jgi:hypothetical protein
VQKEDGGCRPFREQLLLKLIMFYEAEGNSTCSFRLLFNRLNVIINDLGNGRNIDDLNHHRVG